MKRARKMLAILVAMAMTLGMTATAFASGELTPVVNGKSGDSGIIRVSGIVDESKDITVTAYKIVEAKYEGDENSFSGYESLYPGVISVNNNGAENPEFDRAALSEILKTIKSKGTEGESMIPDEEEPGTYKATVAPGSYLIVVENGNAIYNPMVSSLYYKNVEGKNTLEAKDASAKSTKSPEIHKKVISENDEKVAGNTLNVGESVPYEVTIEPIPYYGGTNPQLKVTDTLSKGLKYKGDLVVKVISGNNEAISLNEGVDYSLNIENGIVVDFVMVGETGTKTYTLNQYAGSKVVITYSAELTDDADVNQTANTNSVKLEFTRDSNTTGKNGSTSDNTYTYTFDITGSMNGIFEEGIIKKTGSETTTTTKGLENAEFTLYTNADCTAVYTNTIMKDGKATSDKNGFLLIKGLAAGNYWLKETKAPNGYSLNDRAIPVIITADINPDNGQLVSFNITVDGKKNTFTITEKGVDTTGVEMVEIKNTKLSSLPSTGGIGTTIFTIGGCIIMIVAAGLFFASRRKAAK